jgi:hypothetical protein
MEQSQCGQRTCAFCILAQVPNPSKPMLHTCARGWTDAKIKEPIATYRLSFSRSSSRAAEPLKSGGAILFRSPFLVTFLFQ